MPVERLNPDGAVTGDDADEFGHTQAPLVVADQVVIVDRLERGVDKDGKGQRLSFPRCSLRVGEPPPSLRAVLEYCELDRHTYLGRGQPDARRRFHGCLHLGNERLQLWTTEIVGIDRLGGVTQDGITALNDGEQIGTAQWSMVRSSATTVWRTPVSDALWIVSRSWWCRTAVTKSGVAGRSSAMARASSR